MKNFVLPNEVGFGDIEDLKCHFDTIQLDGIYKKGGLPIYADTKEMCVSSNDTHSLIMGTTGSRKTRSVILPMIYNIANGEEKQSMIIHDTKGDVPQFTYNYLKEKGYDIYVLNFRDPLCSDHYNVFDSAVNLMKKDRKKSKRKLREISSQLFEDGLASEKDPYWHTTVSSYFMALVEAIAVITKYNTRYVNFLNIMKLHSLLSNSKRLSSELCEILNEKGENHCAEGISSIFDNATDTKKNLISMVTNPFSVLDSISNLSYTSDFSANDIGTKPTCVFLVTPDESDEYNFIISLLVKQIYSELIEIASQHNGNTLPITVNFIIDEFGSLPKIQSFNQMISAARSRNIRFHLVVQTFCQLRQIYNEYGASNIFNNCESVISLRSNDSELENILRSSIGNKTLPFSSTEISLISPGTLRKLEKGQAISLIQGLGNPIMVRYPDISEYECYPMGESDCLSRKRTCKARLYKFEAYIDNNGNKIKKNIFNIKSVEMSDAEYLDKFKERWEEINEYKKHKNPVIVDKNIGRIGMNRYDIIVNGVTYGYEMKLFDAIKEITMDEDKRIAQLIYELSEYDHRFMIRCQNKKQFIHALDLLNSHVKIRYNPING